MIYFAQAVSLGHIKIGSAKEPQKRLAELATGCPFSLRLLATTEGGPRDETKLHRRFAHARRKGEWFFPAEDLVSYMARECELQPPPFAGLVAVCSALAGVWEAAILCHLNTPARFCANEVFYGYEDAESGLKDRLSRLVGWERRGPRWKLPDAARKRLEAEAAAKGHNFLCYPLSELVRVPDQLPPPTEAEKYLSSSKAYDIAYDAIFEALPDCRPGCACTRIGEALGGHVRYE